MTLHQRKPTRLPNYNYNTPGYYFVTLCTDQKQILLCDIVGAGLLDGPKCLMSKYGETAYSQLEQMKDFYPDIVLEKYVIMPNHIHLLLHTIGEPRKPESPSNNRVSRFVGTFKRFAIVHLAEISGNSVFMTMLFVESGIM